MHLALRGLAIAAFAAALAAPAVPAQAAVERPGVKIEMIYYDSPGPDRGGNRSLNGEYIRLKNDSRRTVDLRGWTVSDRQFRHTFDHYRLRPGQRVVLHTGQGRDRSGHVFWDRRWYVWNNSGVETATLRDARRHRVDTCTYRGSRRAPYVYC
jgi:hypothetical protein